MKNYFMASLLALCLLTSCSKDEIETQSTDIKNNSEQGNSIQKSIAPEELLESFAMVLYHTKQSEHDSIVLHLALKNFDGSLNTPSEIIFNKRGYTDDGEGNDLLRGDGIYSSVEAFDEPPENGYVAFTSDHLFDFDDELDEWVTRKFGPSGGYYCNLGLAKCPETSWLNECWFGSPCTCITIDCSFSVGFDFF